MTRDQVMRLLRRRIEQAGSQAKFCDENNISTGQLNDVLNGRRPISPKILKALGLKKREEYSRVD